MTFAFSLTLTAVCSGFPAILTWWRTKWTNWMPEIATFACSGQIATLTSSTRPACIPWIDSLLAKTSRCDHADINPSTINWRRKGSTRSPANGHSLSGKSLDSHPLCLTRPRHSPYSTQQRTGTGNSDRPEMDVRLLVATACSVPGDFKIP
jgi:hypothetical protein